jgi:hypothetical protein
MKTIISKRALDKAVDRAMKAQYLVDTGAVGSINMVLAQIGDTEFCDAWVVDNADALKENVRFQAFGNRLHGEILMSNFGEHKSVHLVGKGREEHGLVLLIQRTGDVFSVVWNCDLPDKRTTFFMTATDDVLLIQLITILAEKNFPTVNSESVQRAVSLLMGGASNE